jgi:hypothetical protein
VSAVALVMETTEDTSAQVEADVEPSVTAAEPPDASADGDAPDA